MISDGSVSLASTGPLSVSQPVQTQGTVTLGSLHSGIADANVTVSPSASVVSSGGAVRLTCDDGDVNPADRCSIDVPAAA